MNKIDLTKFIFIEKELLNPVNGEIVGPYYHVYQLDENGNKIELFVTKTGDIKDAVREAERELDIMAVAIAYSADPNSFYSCTLVSQENPGSDFELTEEDVNKIQAVIENAKKRSEKA